MGKYEDECYKRYFDFLFEVDKRPKNIDVVMSKRQLNIAKEAEKRYLGRPEHQYYSAEDLARAFSDGAEWADQHPKIERLWHDVSEEPQENEYVLIQDEENDYDVVLTKSTDEWNTWCGTCKISRWAYISDLLPKGGRK